MAPDEPPAAAGEASVDAYLLAVFLEVRRAVRGMLRVVVRNVQIWRGA